jgi:hypothetical protein
MMSRSTPPPRRTALLVPWCSYLASRTLRNVKVRDSLHRSPGSCGGRETRRRGERVGIITAVHDASQHSLPTSQLICLAASDCPPVHLSHDGSGAPWGCEPWAEPCQHLGRLTVMTWR